MPRRDLGSGNSRAPHPLLSTSGFAAEDFCFWRLRQLPISSDLFDLCH